MQHEASDQGPYCLLTGIPMQNTLKIKTSPGLSKTRYELFEMIEMDKPTGQIRVNVRKMCKRKTYQTPV